jgi:hypothetical protein
MMNQRRSRQTLETVAREWGLPNWEDPSSYGDVTKWDYNRWRWEFYRRRDDVRRHFDEAVNDPSSVREFTGPARDKHQSEGIACPNTPGFMVQTAESAKLFGYFGIPNPRISEQPKDAITPITDWRPIDSIGPREAQDQKVEVLLAAAGVELTDYQRWFLELTLLDRYAAFIQENELALKFDLDAPINTQLAAAKDLLAAKQIERHGSKISTRQHTTKWFVYLRLLDAKPDGLEDDNTPPYLSELEKIIEGKERNPQSVRDSLAQARALRFKI